MKRNIRPINLYLKLLKKNLKNYSRKLDNCQQIMEKIWETMKEVLVKLNILKMTF